MVGVVGSEVLVGVGVDVGGRGVLVAVGGSGVLVAVGVEGSGVLVGVLPVAAFEVSDTELTRGVCELPDELKASWNWMKRAGEVTGLPEAAARVVHPLQVAPSAEV